MEVQAGLGSDIALVFDECTPFRADYDYTARSTERTAPLARALPRLARANGPAGQAVFGIVQGGTHEDLRRQSAAAVAAAGVDGIAIGGTLGKDKEQMRRSSAMTAGMLPDEPPRHLLGIGEPDDLVAGIGGGHRQLRLRRPDPARPARDGAGAAARAPLPLRRPQARATTTSPAAGRRLPVPGVPRFSRRLRPLPLEGRGADRRPPAHAPQPRLFRSSSRAPGGDRRAVATRLPGRDHAGAAPWEARGT
jgi:hypothetical protein